MSDATDPALRILGSVEVLDGTATVAVRSRRQRALLSVLLLEANRVVPADRLVEALWGDVPPEDPGGSLRTQVSRLRRRLPPLARLTAEAPGYRLDVDPDEVDLLRFERLVLAAEQEVGDNALRLVHGGLALWRGPPLEELRDFAPALVEQRRLEELHLGALERRLALLLEVGRAAEAAVDAEVLLAEHPERERVRAALMEALYRLGRATDALHVYQSWRRELGERGLEPSPALRDLEARIVRHGIDGREADRDRRRTPIPPGRVPRPVSTFIGRDAERRAVAELVTSSRVVTLWGPGGVGKTRLALEVATAVADRYPDGVHLGDLTPLATEGDVLRAIAGSVGVQDRSGRRLDALLVDRLQGARVLLVLDNCEHVLAAVAGLVDRVVQSTPGVDVLVTSRERLGVDGEHLWEVRPLDADGPGSPAVELFVDRARAIDPAFAPSPADREEIADLCRRLDGLPLAVELGAARVRGLSVRGLLGALDVRPEVLQGGVARPSRHRSLRAVLDWSYSLLDPEEQWVFDRLAVFPGAFGMDGAAAVVAGDEHAVASVELAVLALLDRALLVERGGGSTRRYGMLDTVRRYGLEHLRSEAALDRAAERHARWVVEQCERAARGLAGPDEAAWATAVEEALDDARAAHRWLVGHDPEGSLRLIAALRPYALWRGHAEIFRWAEVAVAAAAATGSPRVADALLAASTGASQRGDLAGARASAGAILATDDAGERSGLEAAAEVALLTGDLEQARDGYESAHRLALAAGDELQAVWDLGSAAIATGYLGDADGGLRLAAEASATAERCGSPSARAFAEFSVGEVLAAERPEAAEAHLRRAVELASAVDCRFVAGLAEVGLAASRSRQRDTAAAVAHCRSAIVRWHGTGAWTALWVTMRTVVAVLARTGADADAAVLLGATQSAPTSAPPFGVDALALADAERRLREALGDSTFERHRDTGRALGEAGAVERALAALDRASAASSLDADARASRRIG